MEMANGETHNLSKCREYVPVEFSATDGTSVSYTHAKSSGSITEKRREDSKRQWSGRIGVKPSSHMTELCDHGRRAAVVTGRRSSQTTLQLGKGGDSCPLPHP